MKKNILILAICIIGIFDNYGGDWKTRKAAAKGQAQKQQPTEQRPVSPTRTRPAPAPAPAALTPAQIAQLQADLAAANMALNDLQAIVTARETEIARLRAQVVSGGGGGAPVPAAPVADANVEAAIKTANSALNDVIAAVNANPAAEARVLYALGISNKNNVPPKAGL